MNQASFDFVGVPKEEIEDLVEPEFLVLFPQRRYSEEYLYEKEKLRKYVETHGGVGMLVGEPNYMINDPRYCYCHGHKKFCHGTMIFETSWYEDFHRVKYVRLCWPAYEMWKLDHNVRKWQIPASTLYRGEENLLYDDFCYYHLTREGRRIQSRFYNRTGDLVGAVECCPMCDEAEDEIAKNGGYVEICV